MTRPARAQKHSVDRCHFAVSRSAARDTTTVGQCESALADARALRLVLKRSGSSPRRMPSRSDALAAALDAAGPAAVAQVITALRTAPFLAFDLALDQPGGKGNALANHEERKQAQAEAAWTRLEALSPMIAAAFGGKPKLAQPTAPRAISFAGHDLQVP